MAGTLSGKVAIVTGAGKGMGAAMARALVQEGARVAGIDNDTPALAERAIELGDGFMSIPADVSTIAQCEATVARVVASWGGLDILVNNAGVGMTVVRPPGHKGKLRFWEGDPAGWQKLLTINHGGAYFMARFATPHMLARGWGRIINVTTNFDTMLSPGRFAYGPSKAALEAGSAIWAQELEGSGVTVNVLIPGRQTNTTMFPPELPRDGMLSPRVMMAPIVWLASDASKKFSGCRFIAELWGKDGPPEPVQPIAWPQLKRRVS
jgi:3-oxoacyl-[acyl-carrier protein] reductase